MNILLLGHGKTGSRVAETARHRGHNVRVIRSAENTDGAAIVPEKLSAFNVVIDFTTPSCVLRHIEACVKARKNMVVGTTGWYTELPRIKQMVEQQGTGLLYAANFSIGINLFLDIARTAAGSLKHGYSGQIFERHHDSKNDAPSGTALAIQDVIRDAAETSAPAELEIVSFREGEVVGMHEVVLDSPADRIYLCHDAKSRQGFAEGAVRAAEWLEGRKGFYDFKDIWREL
jgi:4-hydroxy-tetrahydrodipicolinate reductase